MIARMLPALDIAAVRHYCEQHVPPDIIDQLRTELDVSRGPLTIMECRPPRRADLVPEWTRHGVARLRFETVTGSSMGARQNESGAVPVTRHAATARGRRREDASQAVGEAAMAATVTVQDNDRDALEQAVTALDNAVSALGPE